MYARGASHLALNAYGGANVGIGLTNPGEKIDVADAVKCQAIYLNATSYPAPAEGRSDLVAAHDQRRTCLVVACRE